MRRNYTEEVTHLLKRQFFEWDTVRENYEKLSQASTRTLKLGVSSIVMQFNPGRIHSSTASITPESISKRPCFLCDKNQPALQDAVMWEGRYKIQVNPYPIFRQHLTISAVEHTPQTIYGRFADMLHLAQDLKDYVVFYNGPHSGASAPDHMHFQAGRLKELPFCSELPGMTIYVIDSSLGCHFGYVTSLCRPLFYINTPSLEQASMQFDDLLSMLPLKDGHSEPMINILCWYQYNSWYVAVIPRSKHRPSCYGSGERQFLVSPAAVELGGLWALAREEDYNKITVPDVADIYSDVCLSTAEVSLIADKLTKYYQFKTLTHYGTSSPSESGHNERTLS